MTTLGDETLQVLRRIPALTAEPPADTMADLHAGRYGARRHLTVNGRRVELLPLVHPGVLKERRSRFPWTRRNDRIRMELAPHQVGQASSGAISPRHDVAMGR